MSQTGPLCSDRNEYRVSHHLGLPEICVLYFQFQRIRYHHFSQYRIDILGNPLNFGEIMVLHPIKGRGFAPQQSSTWAHGPGPCVRCKRGSGPWSFLPSWCGALMCRLGWDFGSMINLETLGSCNWLCHSSFFLVFSCFFDFGRIIATNAQKNLTRALPCFSDIHLYHLDMGHCCISLNGQPAHGSSNYFVAGPATVALSQMWYDGSIQKFGWLDPHVGWIELPP